MNPLFDFIPLLVFFIAFRLKDVYVATAALMVATLAMVTVHWIRHRKVTLQQWLILGLTLVFGSLTLFFHDQRFLQVKPTIIEWFMALGLLINLKMARTPVLQGMLEPAFLPMVIAAEAWKKATWLWCLFLFGEGLLNLYVAANFPLATWVAFKTFGLQILGVVFALGQAWFLYRRARPVPEASAPVGAEEVVLTPP